MFDISIFNKIVVNLLDILMFVDSIDLKLFEKLLLLVVDHAKIKDIDFVNINKTI